MYYLRKVTRGKWDKTATTPQATAQDLQAYTIFYDLSVKDDNKLSVWEIKDKADEEDALIALASNRSLGTLCAVKMSERDLSSLNFDQEPGDTPTHNIDQKHRNITDLTYGGMDVVIQAIFREAQAGRYIRKTKRDVKDLLLKAYRDHKLDVDKMSEDLLVSLGLLRQ